MAFNFSKSALILIINEHSRKSMKDLVYAFGCRSESFTVVLRSSHIEDFDQALSLKMKMSVKKFDKKMELKVTNAQLVKNEVCPPPKFRAYPEIVMKGDSSGVLSSILPRVVMIHDVRSCYMYKIREVGDF